VETLIFGGKFFDLAVRIAGGNLVEQTILDDLEVTIFVDKYVGID